MIRKLVPLCLASLVATAGAQCFQSTGASTPMTPDGSGYPAFDEGYSAELPLGFTFPMAGVGYPITHFVIDSNGEVYLTDGGGVVNPSGFGTDSLTVLRGGAGGSARVMAMGGDNEGASATSDILVDTSVAGRCKVTWRDWSRYGNADSWSCSVVLYDTGVIDFDYGAGFAGVPFNGGDLVGVSIGDDVGTGTELSSDLSAGGDTGTLGLVYQNRWPFDLENATLTLTPNGTGGFGYGVSCDVVPASHTNYGTGCYTIPPSAATQAFYQAFADAAAIHAALQGQSIRLTPNGTGDGYDVTWGGGSYVAPSGAAIDLGLTDDSQMAVTPTTPFPYVFGAVATLWICSNGFVSMGPGNSVFAYGSVGALLGSPIGSFRSNADLDPGAAGAVKVEEVGGVLYVTWEDVPRFLSPDPERFQMQFDLGTGVVTCAWDLLSTAGTGDTVVGYAPGPSLDPGSIVLATALPITTTPEVTIQPIRMSASPAPISTVSTGTTVTYHIDDIPDAWVNSGVFFGVTILSLAGDLVGTGLSGIGAPGCFLYVGSLDLTIAFVGATPTQTTSFFVPAGLPIGTEFYGQSAALVFPNSLPNGQNAFGAVTSNGVRSYVSDL